MKIVVLFPTASEAEFFHREGVEVAFCGVGIAAAAYMTTKVILEKHPDVLIMGGIAGVYPHSSLKVGDTVLVGTEHLADLGFFYEDGFRPFSAMNFDMNFELVHRVDCPWLKPDMPLHVAVSNTMNSAMAPYVRTEGVDVESMEGAPFFYVCQKEGVRFFEVRSVSNVVDLGHGEWDYRSSIRNMTEGVHKMIDYLLSE